MDEINTGTSRNERPSLIGLRARTVAPALGDRSRQRVKPPSDRTMNRDLCRSPPNRQEAISGLSLEISTKRVKAMRRSFRSFGRARTRLRLGEPPMPAVEVSAVPRRAAFAVETSLSEGRSPSAGT
ncbi:hypothetical protein ABZU32_35550 [Sphaerisporangium sp. NPDC005288]|uniref:hypothetical protein n=1 Tax=Sphaerisporangium sp. NPDC005288 TaxID=3155114 RepID=UPI0033BB80CC